MNCGDKIKMKKWSSQWRQFMQLRKDAWKKNSGLQRGLNPWPRDLPVRCSTTRLVEHRNCINLNLCLIIHSIWLSGIYSAWHFHSVSYTLRQVNLTFRYIYRNLRLASLHCSVIAVVGWDVAGLVNAKVRVRPPVKPEVFFTRMLPACMKFKRWELFVMNAWETY